jgi:hypothetical protein
MQAFPLTFCDGHLFVTIDTREWLLDTGAPTSIGDIPLFVMENKTFNIPDNYMGLTGAKLSEFVGRPTVGIIGADILGKFDTLFDESNGRVSFSHDDLKLEGDVTATEEFMGIPIIEVGISGTQRRLYFDSGAQISYFQNDSLLDFPSAGKITDFFPGVGQFQTETYLVEIALGRSRYTLRCGSLPELLGRMLTMAKTEGIVGNEILRNRVVGFFPRRHQLVLT